MQKLYPWISLHPVGLSDHAGTERFYLDESPALSSFDIRRRVDVHVVGEINVAVTALDDVAEVQAIRELSLMKVDVEGAELQVIKGAIHTIKKYRPLILMELDWEYVLKINPARYAAGDHEREMQSFLAWLKELDGGYLALDLFGDPIECYDPHAWNIVLVPKDFETMSDLQHLLQSAGRSFFTENRTWMMKSAIDVPAAYSVPGVKFVVDPAVCGKPGLRTAAKVSWNVAIPGIERVDVLVLDENNREKLFVGWNEVMGSAQTGAWVGAGMVFILRDASNRKLLGKFYVGSKLGSESLARYPIIKGRRSMNRANIRPQGQQKLRTKPAEIAAELEHTQLERIPVI